jgi:predicted transcriptional regulator
MLRLEMTESYADTLERAQKELAVCDAEAQELERKRAKLRQVIGSLQSLMGIEAPSGQSLTEAILMALIGSDRYVTATEVMARLVQIGFKETQMPSVATILSRLAKSGKITTNPVGPNQLTGYGWNMKTNRAERRAAKRTLKAVKNS